MQISEYNNMYKSESSHFYYVGTHSILLALLNKHLTKKTKLKILDAGCGTGLFAKKLESFGTVIGVDMEEEALKFARKRKIQVKKGSITNLPFGNNTFDLVVSNDVICHKSIKNDRLAITELTRVLKPSGLLLLKLPAFNWLMGSHDTEVHTKKRYTKEEIEHMLKKEGHALVKSTYAGSFLVIPVLLKNWFDALLGKPSYSSIQNVGQLINSLLIYFFSIEKFFVSFLEIPTGITIITLSRKQKL